jgi:molybdenum cofactor cytidylyltransferase
VLAAVILSGGESRRMGSPKALIPYRGRTFLEHLLDVAKHPKISPTVVVLGPHADPIRKQVALDAVNVVINQEWEKGQLSSIQAAVRHLLLDDASDGFLLFLVDHPFVSAELVDQLASEFYRSDEGRSGNGRSGKAIVLPAFHGKRGHPVIFARRLYEELLAAPLDKGARTVVWAHADEVLEVPTEEEGVVLNVNDPETLRKTIGGG